MGPLLERDLAKLRNRVVSVEQACGSVGIDGPHSNVLKIRPPLVFREADADQLVDALDRALQSFRSRALDSSLEWVFQPTNRRCGATSGTPRSSPRGSAARDDSGVVSRLSEADLGLSKLLTYSRGCCSLCQRPG